MSPTARTLKALRDQGYKAGKVEQTVPHTFITRDLFGFIDIIAAGHGQVLAVQATSGSNVSSRMDKIRLDCRDCALEWLKAGALIQVWGWRKVGPRGERKLWRPLIQDVRLSDLDVNPPGAQSVDATGESLGTARPRSRHIGATQAGLE